MITMYVDLATMEICTRRFLTKQKCPGVVLKQDKHPLTDYDLGLLGAALLAESATGDVVTGRAILLNDVYVREYRSFTAEELAAPALAALAEADIEMPRAVEDLISTLIGLGVMVDDDLPLPTQVRLTNKRNLRAALPTKD